MCGITGFINASQNMAAGELEQAVSGMSDAISHRGPDDNGAWVDAESGVALGFRRLAIVDLTPTGRQPMVSHDGRYIIVYNGEVYNFASLRSELASLGASFHGTSDTEVILEAFSIWGLEAAVKRFNGMFAFALWDRRKRQLSLVRDRLGIKPLYYGWAGDNFLFGSELKSLRAHPAFHNDIDRNSLSLYLRHSCIPAPYSIFKNISKLPPGTILKVGPGIPHREIVPLPYWSVREAAESGVADPFTGNASEAVDALDSLLKDSIRLRMVADVPLGAFLSGGVDSSVIVALMQAQSSQPVRTFTIGFNEQEFNEAVFAKTVAHHLGTDHTELYVSPQEAMDVIPLIPRLYDEPFSDSSQVPTYLVSALTRRHVTVSLSGDGGDELFAGYTRYASTSKLLSSLGLLPPWSRSLAAKALGAFPSGLLRPPFLPGRFSEYAGKLQKLQEVLGYQNSQDLYRRVMSHWQDPTSLVIGSREPPTILTDPSKWAHLPDFTREMMYLDMVSYLPDDILAKVDRASMGVSLEARAPFLDDHRVVEFAWKVPLSMKVRGGVSKWLLRQVLYRYVPEKLIDRPKMGFAVPIGGWLRGPLRPWAEDLLDRRRLLREGYFNPDPIRKKWEEHLARKHDWKYYLWDILMFQAWLAEAH